MYDPRVDHATFKSKLMLRFKDDARCKGVVRKWPIIHGNNLRCIKSSSKQLDARCQEGCNWRLYMPRHENTFMIKTLTDVHTCYSVQRNRHVTTEFMVNEFMDKCKRNPFWPVKEMEAEMMDKYGVIVRNWQCYKARHLAQKMIKGTLEEHYGKVRRYLKEQMRIDPNGSFILQADLDENTNKSIFKRVYVVTAC